jgi:CheY-like chemotaxis protein/nitrogen-specific signal transduction histidine kinase
MVLRIDALEKEKAELKKQLRQARKMEAIGTLAGGIVHEFNNILFPIIGYTEMCMYDVPENSKTKKNLASVLKAADRAKELIQQIQNFCTKEGNKRKSLKIQYVIKESLKLLRASMPSTIDMRHEIDNACGPVSADPSDVQQIIMNLCSHAYQAMEENGGVLEVTLSEMHSDSFDLLSEVGLCPGSYLKLTVIVKGPGLEHDEAKYIFDPHHFTGGRDDIAGTALDIAYEIVQSYGGKVHVCPILNQGTTVDVYFPLIDTPSGNMFEISAEAPMPFGDERLLLVDDEIDVLEMMHFMLERLGYRVDSTISSIEALDRFREKPEKFDMVITDQTMPQMTGMELIRKLRLVRSDIPIILCTGYNEKITEDQAGKSGAGALINKPARIAEIAGKIRDVLDRKS